ncbi:PREDICTED: altered inheritance of mitochondria protein 44-like [Ipomoea nil]|uniref:altered inheritance of mitochondria protein 44-like n=1 Tax=Ipomoea nil TaxID=35883 RepID=UPI000900BA7D|nr:PREDICTED: altered inheritance of mitochondria protein 44-like [Ipomoea nil]
MKSRPSGYDKQRPIELNLPIPESKSKWKSKRKMTSESDQRTPKRQRRSRKVKHSSEDGSSPSLSAVQENESDHVSPKDPAHIPTSSQLDIETNVAAEPIPQPAPVQAQVVPPSTQVHQISSSENTHVKNSSEGECSNINRADFANLHSRPIHDKAQEIMTELAPSPTSTLSKFRRTLDTPPPTAQGGDKTTNTSAVRKFSKVLAIMREKKKQKSTPESSFPQEPTVAEQVHPILTQEPAIVEKDRCVPSFSDLLSLPQEPGLPKETREEINETSLAPPPSKDQLLRQSIFEEYQRVLRWQKWRTSPLDVFLAGLNDMKEEETFALDWMNTKDVYEAIRPPVFLDIVKPSYDDPTFEAEIKTELEKLYKNDPHFSTSGTKDIKDHIHLPADAQEEQVSKPNDSENEIAESAANVQTDEDKDTEKDDDEEEKNDDEERNDDEEDEADENSEEEDDADDNDDDEGDNNIDDGNNDDPNDDGGKIVMLTPAMIITMMMNLLTLDELR